MGNTFKFLLEYKEYMNNIENLSQKNDYLIFSQLKSQRIVEGLMKTHPLEVSSNIIKKRFSELNTNIEDDGEIYIDGNFEKLKKYLPLFTNLGYFISKITIDGENWTKEFNNDTIPSAMFLEPKYDLKISKIPNILYHASLKKYDNKISKIGFIPKSGNKLSNHPERIYLTDDLSIAKSFGKSLKQEYNEEYIIYEIDTKDLDINLYSDINMRNGGYYTLSNIPKEYFKKII